MTELRSMNAVLDGYVWLPRMIDKSRAASDGTLGDGVHPCPVDRRCLALLGIDARSFGVVVARSIEDAEVLAGLRAAGIASAGSAWFDAPAWEEALKHMVWLADGETISNRSGRHVVILEAESAITVTWSRYATGERGPDLHLHRAHTDAFYVLSGALRFGFGPEGERVVRAPAGTFVAAPAGVAHSFVNEEADDATWLNVHTPDAGFAAFMRGARDDRVMPFDSFEVSTQAGGGGRPAAEAVVVAPDAGGCMSYGGSDLRVVADRFRVDVVVPTANAPVTFCRI